MRVVEHNVLRQIRTLGVMLALTAACAGGSAAAVNDGAVALPDAATSGPLPDAHPTGHAPRRIAILMIGDGMGRGQLATAGEFAHGAPGTLALQALPRHGELTTGSLSGITDSAAAATLMATGVRTFNGRIGLDRDGAPVETLVEQAHRLGLAAGVVSTSSLPHATPAGFTAHRGSRGSYLEIANDQALLVKPEVMLGGGTDFYAPHDGNASLVPPLEADGYQVVYTADELQAVTAAGSAATKIVGLFAPEHLDYVVDRAADTTQPTLTAMSLAALATLDRAEDGFFLMIEGARIDMASHGNDLARAVHETVAFDDAVTAVAAWAAAHPDDEITLLVTADHECGGLTITAAHGAGVLPDVEWRWGQHTNARVDIYGSGPGSELFDGALRDHAWVHAVLAARLAGADVTAPAPVLVPDGHLADLRWRATEQTVVSGFGPGWNELDALHVDADARGLAVGVEGLFEWQRNAVVILIDVDPGAATGPARLAGALADTSGQLDAILAGLSLDAPAGVPGFGVDFAIASWGGADPHLEELHDDGGLRGLRAPVGAADDLWWYGAALNFGEGVRTRGAGAPVAVVPGEGFETFIPWHVLYPGLGDAVPPGATVAIVAVLVNDDGGFTSNQALPSFAPGAANPGRTVTALPGVVAFTVDSNGDGVGDGELAPTTM